MKLEHLSKCNLCDSKDIYLLYKDQNIFKCDNCGYIFDNPRPTFDEIENYYSRDNKYEMWLREEKSRNILWKRRLRMVKKYKNMGTLLDVGAGIGQFLYYAKNYFEVEGTEISDSAIKTAKKKYGLNLSKGQVEDIDFVDRKYDVITLFHVLEHATNPSRLINRCYNLLNKQGILIIAVPNDINSLRISQIKYLSILRIGKFKRSRKFRLPKLKLNGTLSEIHLSHFTSLSLKKLLVKNIFTIIEDTLDPYYAAVGINKIINDLVYLIFLVIKKITNCNLYKTIWIVAKRE